MGNNTIFALILTLLAGLSTVIGALFVFWKKSRCAKFLSFGIGLSAGVMIYVSFFELLRESDNLLRHSGNRYDWLVVAMFLSGLAVAGIIDTLTHNQLETCPSSSCGKDEGVNTARTEHEEIGRQHRHGKYWRQRQALLKTGIFSAIVIALHNFPEGIVTFTTASFNTVFGLSIATAIAIHNIPEGFCIALPIYHATYDKKKSIMFAVLAGLSEPLGALLAFFIFAPFINDLILGIMLAAVAGIMVYVALDELLPTARKLGHKKISLLGMLFGLVIMAFSLFLLR